MQIGVSMPSHRRRARWLIASRRAIGSRGERRFRISTLNLLPSAVIHRNCLPRHSAPIESLSLIRRFPLPYATVANVNSGTKGKTVKKCIQKVFDVVNLVPLRNNLHINIRMNLRARECVVKHLAVKHNFNFNFRYPRPYDAGECCQRN